MEIFLTISSNSYPSKLSVLTSLIIIISFFIETTSTDLGNSSDEKTRSQKLRLFFVIMLCIHDYSEVAVFLQLLVEVITEAITRGPL